MYDSVTPSKVINLSGNIRLLNFLLVFDDVNDKFPPALKNTFHLTSYSHYYTTHGSVNQKVSIPSVRTMVYGHKKYYFSILSRMELFYKSF